MIIQFNIPDAVAPRALDGFCEKKNYSIQKLPNETKGEFFKRMTIQWWKDAVKDAEGEPAASVARIQASNSVETDITIT